MLTVSRRLCRASVAGAAFAGLAVVIVAALAASAPAATRGPQGSCVRPDVLGDTTLNVRYRGTAYRVLVYVPEDLPRRRVPLVLNLHPSSGNGPQQMTYSGLRRVADDNEFIVAAPNGVIPLPSPQPDPNGNWAWNVPGVPTTAGAFPPPGARNDVRFLARVITALSSRLCTDLDRTYSTGYSGGARMTSALACRLADRIAAIAPVAGVRAGRPDPEDVSVPEIEDCLPERAVPVVTFHGQQDVVNVYQGSADLRWGYSVPVAVQTWARIDGCRRGPRAAPVSEHVTLFRYGRCADRAEVDFYRVSNGGHTWPGSSVELPGWPTTQEINASEIIWDFFRDYRLSDRNCGHRPKCR